MNDLLPLSYTETTLACVADHIDQVQQALGRRMLLENPSTYLAFAETTMPETDFLAEIGHRTGCGMLLDVNNVYVSATNQNSDMNTYINAFPLDLVREIHLGGHDPQMDEHGEPLLIDSHGAPVADPVWRLYGDVLRLTGPKPTLIEWDNNVPDWPDLANDAARAASILDRVAA